MPALGSYNIGDKLNVVMIGRPGSGKTIALASFPCTPKENSKIPFGHWNAQWDWRERPLLTYYGGDNAIVKGTSVMSGMDVVRYASNEYNAFAEKLEKQEVNTPYKTISVDSLTALSRAIVDYSISMRPSEKAANPQRKFRAKGQIDLPEIEDYGVESQALGNIADFLKVLPCHTILTAHYLEWSSKNVVTGTEEKVSRLITAGKGIAAALPGNFDEVWYFERKTDMSGKQFYWCHFRGGYPDTKTALPLPDKIDWTGKNFFEELKKLLAAKGIKLAE